MRLFSCQSCSQVLFFENTRCQRCGHDLGFWPDLAILSALEPSGPKAEDRTQQRWTGLGLPAATYRLCANARFDVCNWLVDADSGHTMCTACRRNRIIPGLGNPENRISWAKIEAAKHRLFYSLFRLGLVQNVDIEHSAQPLTFRFMSDGPSTTGKRVVTGHNRGTITIAVSEADDAERERRRKAMNEPYRTLIGHFRHETGHYYWARLVREGGRLESCRAVFGDDSVDYRQALQRHYKAGAPADWQTRFVSAYASSHPWEDFAETWAHYLHIIDALELARAYDLKMAPSVDKDHEFAVAYPFDPYDAPDIGALIRLWLPISTALNTFNRTMGKDELYPFILSPPVIVKLGFMHELIRDATRHGSRAGGD